MLRICVLMIALSLTACDKFQPAAPTSATPDPDPVRVTPAPTPVVAPTPTNVVQLPVDRINSETRKPGDTIVFNGPHISDVKDNTWIYVNPWTMWVDHHGHYYINMTHGYYTAHEKDFIQINHMGNEFYVFLDDSKYVWTPYEVDVQPGYADTMPVKILTNVWPPTK